jgi:phosphate-selective porin OprO/OprP
MPGLCFQTNFFNKRLGWQGGLFRRSNSAGDDTKADDGYAITTQLTGLPYANEDKTKLLHLGVGFSYRKPESREYEIEARPESHLGNKYVNTGAISNVLEIQMFNVEAAAVMGAFSLQGGYTNSNVATKATTSENYVFHSYYAEASYFLTRETRKYKGSYAGFGRVKPKNNFNKREKGKGAWQLALRYSAIDLNSGDSNTTGIAGGELADFTVGINWYLNPATRVMFNYVLAKVKEQGSAGIVQMRFQIDF